MYIMSGRIRYSEVGMNGQLKLHHLINYFQDCSTFQLQDIGLGTDYFKSQQLGFFILSWQVEINRLPKENEVIKVETSIYECNSRFGYRNYILYDDQDQILAYANLSGVFMNMSTGSFARLSDEEISKYPIDPKLEMDYLPRKIKLPVLTTSYPEIKINRYQIDTNGHVNNSHYIALALECLPSNLNIKRFCVEYKKAAKYGDIMIPKTVQANEIYYVALNDEGGKPYVVLSFYTEIDAD